MLSEFPWQFTRTVSSIPMILIILLSPPVFAEEGKGKRSHGPAEKMKAFILHSDEEDHVCGAPQGRGITESLRKEFKDGIQIRSHFMNTKTINSAPDKMKTEALLVLREVASFKPNVVFVLDDDAFREVGLKLNGKSHAVIFSGLNGQPENYSKTTPFLDSKGRPSSNITGVYEKLHFQTALNVMRGVIPDLKKIVPVLHLSSPPKRFAPPKSVKAISLAFSFISVSFIGSS